MQIDAGEDDAVCTGIREGNVGEADAVTDALGDGVVRSSGFAVGDVPLEPLEPGVHLGDALQVVEKGDRRRDLLVDLRGQRDGQHNVADAPLARDRVVDDEKDTGDVARGKHKLAGGPKPSRFQLRAPEPAGGSLPQLGVAPLDLLLEAEDTQLLGRSGTRRQPEEVHRQPRVLSGLLARPIDDRLSPLPRDERWDRDQRKEQQEGIDERQQDAGQADRDGQAR